MTPIFVYGRPVEPTDAVAEVLRYLKAYAAIARGGAQAHNLARAVFTIPVDLGGPRSISQLKAEGAVPACLESPNYCGFERPRQSKNRFSIPTLPGEATSEIGPH